LHESDTNDRACFQYTREDNPFWVKEYAKKK